MGYFRVILALMVVFSHRGSIGIAGWFLQGGAIFAVKAFFMVSGFYMALVIHDRYHSLPVASFYASRALRLLPIYWILALITIVAEYVLARPGEQFYSLVSPLYYWGGPNGLHAAGIPAGLWAYLAISETTLIGADTWLWLGFSSIDGTLSLAPDYGPHATSGNALSPVPQAWSIGCELWFYLIAPFIVRRLRLVLLLAAGSLVCRFLLARYGFSGEPWNRAVFPSELIFFLLGVLAYHVYLRFPRYRFPVGRERLCTLASLAAACAIAPLSILLKQTSAMDVIPYMATLALLPCLFRATKDNLRDSLVGELSYPLYMVHNLVYGLIAAIPIDLQAYTGKTFGWALFSLIWVVAAAFALDRYVARPIDRLRRKFGARGPVDAPAERPAVSDDTASQSA